MQQIECKAYFVKDLIKNVGMTRHGTVLSWSDITHTSTYLPCLVIFDFECMYTYLKPDTCSQHIHGIDTFLYVLYLQPSCK